MGTKSVKRVPVRAQLNEMEVGEFLTFAASDGYDLGTVRITSYGLRPKSFVSEWLNDGAELRVERVK